METIRRLQFGISLLYVIYFADLPGFFLLWTENMFLGRNPSRTSKHHIMLVVGFIPICAVARQSRPTTKNGCLWVLCRPFCLQPRYYGLPSLLKVDGPTSPGANYEKYDSSENRKVQNIPPGSWVFLFTAHNPHFASTAPPTLTALPGTRTISVEEYLSPTANCYAVMCHIVTRLHWRRNKI